MRRPEHGNLKPGPEADCVRLGSGRLGDANGVQHVQDAGGEAGEVTRERLDGDHHWLAVTLYDDATYLHPWPNQASGASATQYSGHSGKPWRWRGFSVVSRAST
jgi:hypothetical protein